VPAQSYRHRAIAGSELGSTVRDVVVGAADMPGLYRDRGGMGRAPLSTPASRSRDLSCGGRRSRRRSLARRRPTRPVASQGRRLRRRSRHERRPRRDSGRC
jgi:hypothetical protein